MTTLARRELVDEACELAHEAGADHASRPTRRRTSPRGSTALEGCDLECAQLGLALVAAVDAALDDHDRVLDEVLATGAVDLAEDDDLDLRHAVVEAREGHRVAAARGRHAQRRDQTADRDRLVLAPAGQVAQRQVDAAAQLIGHRQRVIGR